MSEAGELPETHDPFRSTKYATVDCLGSGGMGEVYLVEHRELGKRFVAKIMHQRFGADPRLIDRMRVEAEALGLLNHPNIVNVTGFDVTREGRPFIVMEQLRGRTLASELEARGALPVPEALGIAREILFALGAAHGLGIVHRDIKPENVFLHEPPSGARVVKVLDFGVARVLPGASADAPRPLMNPTETGVIVGTPRFLSPEGAVGRRVDERADIYAVGLILYEMLAGRGPFDHITSDMLVVSAHADDAPEPPSRFAASRIPMALDGAILKALSKDPALRFASAAKFDQTIVAIGARLDEPEAEKVAPRPSGGDKKDKTVPVGPRRSKTSGARILAFVAMTVLSAAASAGIARLLQGNGP